MNVEELRIGNYVSLDGEVIQIFKSQIGELFSSNLKPIPLTEEWLIKFGFEDIHNYKNCISLKLLHNGIINAYDIDSKVRIELSTMSGYRVGELEIKYVHQLQNLYFALTGEELTIK